MMWAALLSSPLARKFGAHALVALILVASVLSWRVQVTALRAQRDKAQTEVKGLRSALETMTAQQAVATAAQANRVIEQTKIEVKTNERARHNTALLALPQNKPWGRTGIPDELIDGLLDDSGASPDGVPSVAAFDGSDARAKEVTEGIHE